MPAKLKGKFYRTVVKPAIRYRSECCGLNQAQTKKLQVTELRMLKLTAGATSFDRIRNEYVRGSLGIADIALKLEKNSLRWLGHVNRPTNCKQLSLISKEKAA